jgi:hypothetical protein
MKKRLAILALLTILLFLLPGSAVAQTYLFRLDKETVNLFWNEDGTLAIDYVFDFSNDPSASPIDYVDVGIPNSNFDTSTIFADVDGNQISDISRSGYQGNGDSGVAVGLGEYAIQPGQSGQVHVFIGTVQQVLYPDTQDQNYASAVFIPTYFGSDFVEGATDLTVTFHLPPGVKPDEPKWHSAPSGFPDQPQTGFDDQGRITYTWNDPEALGYRSYEFGASFPLSYVPDSAIVRPNPFAGVINFFSGLLNCLPGLICFGVIILIIVASSAGANRRKLQYLPPRISLEGHGIKRGLTAVEAAILMEQPLDKILTMILFSVIKKNAASVASRDPLKLNFTSPQPEGLYDYEKDFLEAFRYADNKERRKALQTTMINLVKSLSLKMKGFSRKETIAYYQDIIDRAWSQVEAAGTPEVKSQKFDEVMEWTMLDQKYEDRTRNVFQGGPVFVPIWWGRYDPGYGTSASVSTGTTSIGPAVSQAGGPVSLPHLPGSDFAASIVNGVQNFSSGVLGSVTDFTSGITQRTNPPPAPSTSHGGFSGGGGSGCACACACACAGCACACAGGGR